MRRKTGAEKYIDNLPVKVYSELPVLIDPFQTSEAGKQV
jgi:hypothetical protein